MLYTYNHHGNEPLLAAILASGKYGPLVWAQWYGHVYPLCLPSVIVPVYLEFTGVTFHQRIAGSIIQDGRRLRSERQAICIIYIVISLRKCMVQTCQVSRSHRETHDFLCFLTISRLSTEISRFSRKSIEDSELNITGRI